MSWGRRSLGQGVELGSGKSEGLGCGVWLWVRGWVREVGVEGWSQGELGSGRLGLGKLESGGWGGLGCWFCLKLMVLIADVLLYKSPHQWFVFTMFIL